MMYAYFTSALLKSYKRRVLRFTSDKRVSRSNYWVLTLWYFKTRLIRRFPHGRLNVRRLKINPISIQTVISFECVPFVFDVLVC